MKKILKYVLSALIVILFIGTIRFLIKRSKTEEIKYDEYEVVLTDIQRKTIVTGRISPRTEVEIKPQINGIIAELYKEAGQEVQANEVIAKLKVIPDMNSLSAAQSRLRLAEINYTQIQSEYQRSKSLYDRHLISDEEYEKIYQNLAQAKEECSASQDALEIIRDGVSSTNATSSSTLIRSTISGLILDIPVKVGNSVIQANTMNDGTTVATVANMNELIFTGNVDETEVGRLKEGMPLIISIGALQDYKFDASLEYISPKAIENNGSKQFEIKAAVKVNDQQTIRSGYSANAEIILDEAKQVAAIPESALEFSDDSTFVYIKSSKGYDRKAVKTGISDGINIQILEGLKKGDHVRGNQIIKTK